MKRKKISPNIRESEQTNLVQKQNGSHQVINIEFFADQKAGAKSHIQALVRHISREVNRHKLNYHQLKYVFRSVRERCEVEVTGPKSRKLIELPTGEELMRFYGVIENPVHRLIFEVLEETGLRIAELCYLEVRRIDFRTNLVFISEGKGSKDRVTVIGNRMKDKLALYLEGRSNRFLFESNRNTKFTPRRLEQLCLKYKTLAGITKDLTPHTFRHVWNTRLAEAGLSKERRAILAGHADERTQDIYTHLSGAGAKDEVIAILDRR